MGMIKYIPIEMHAHTTHSDGQFTPKQLLKNALHYGYKALIITDHNTTSGFNEANQNSFARGYLLEGVEWTTFYGHLIVIGAKNNGDWRHLLPVSMDAMLRQIKHDGGLVGIAHPYNVGGPICTGCRWEYEVQRWEYVNYIEIWNGPDPQHSASSAMAYLLWRAKLEAGYHISCVAGRDWHRSEGASHNTALTYLGIKGNQTLPKIKKAIALGRMYPTLGPRLTWSIEQDKKHYGMGDVLHEGACELYIHIEDTEIPALQSFSFEPAFIDIYNGSRRIYHAAITINYLLLNFNVTPSFVRIELLDAAQQRLVVSNAIYVQERH